ncbi:hypothetical protein BOW53_14595 [Solemya pervernicosa gill symbiont]|uniref:histidine kinase n=2 Tax=Gammaproteobacteria incertae sedis TaxID=118884 RepID=A0A1T2L0R9_9GAMM|nr:histidine kinase dimerization/phospho-acceptor domain-containing protein [Candidatus Reidiella endopervernicosa]OOZ38672.1 hypothetical protein BOW53_14595 [Solemya pervernicosa gill symbiont]QKQ25183.1 hypothetical protein HUE57_01920 [Candidatus Reidiella endopervernicosa]
MAFKDILKSGFTFDKSEADLVFKFKILNTIMVIAAVFSLLFALLSDLGINDIGEIHAKVDYVYSFISIALLIYIRRSKACYENVAIAFVILSFYVFTSAMIFVPGDEFRLIWYYFVIYITYVLLGERAGVFMTAAVLAAIVICANLFDLQLSENALVTAVLGMLIASLLTRSYTVQMSHYEKELNAKNSALEVSVNELDSALGEAQQASRAKSLFLANMSHEIRTPMNGMLGMVQVMQATELSDEQQHYLETIDRSGKNLLSLIDELLDISKIESGRLELLPRPFDTFQWVIDIQILTEPLFEGRRVDFTTEVSEKLPARLIADEQRLVQIIVNLVGNACKFTSEGDVKLSIGGELIDASNYRLLVNVEDSGIGIPPEKVQDIFDSFHQITPRADR